MSTLSGAPVVHVELKNFNSKRSKVYLERDMDIDSLRHAIRDQYVELSHCSPENLILSSGGTEFVNPLEKVQNLNLANQLITVRVLDPSPASASVPLSLSTTSHSSSSSSSASASSSSSTSSAFHFVDLNSASTTLIPMATPVSASTLATQTTRIGDGPQTVYQGIPLYRSSPSQPLPIPQYQPQGDADLLSPDRFTGPTWGGLSCLSKAFFLFLLGVLILTAIYHLIWAVFVLLLFIPTFVFFWKWRKNSRHAEWDLIVKIYATAFVPGAFVVLVIEALLTIVFALLCLHDQVDEWIKAYKDPDPNSELSLNVHRNFGFYAFLFLLSFVVAGWTEETLKYYLLNRVRKYRPEFRDWLGYLFFGVAAGLGFSTVENIGYFLQTASGQDLKESPLARLGALALLCAERTLISTPLHLMTAYLQALSFIDRNVWNRPKNYFHIVCPAILFHGAFDFFLFLLYASSLDSTEQTVASFLVSVVMLLLLGYFIYYRKNRTLPQDQAGTQPPRSGGLLPVYHPRDQQGGYVPFHSDDREESRSSLHDMELHPVPASPQDTPPTATTPTQQHTTLTTTHHIRGEV